MRIVELRDQSHTLTGGTLFFGDETRLRLPIRSPVVTVTRRRGHCSVTFASMSKAVLQVTGPRETIDAIYKETL